MADRHGNNRQGRKINKGRRNNRISRNRKKEQKQFRIYPQAQINWNSPARTAWVYWPGKGEPLLYRLDFLDNHELRNFWHMDHDQKAEYLSSKFNRHHRRPRCQRGPTVKGNLSQVDICSHNCYNKIISAVACWKGVPNEKVFTKDISNFLRRVYPHLKKLMSRSESEKLKGMDAVIDQKNLKVLNPAFIVSVARWSKIRPQAVHVLDVSRFLEYMYAPIKRLALDHDSDKLKTLEELFKILNDIWLPTDEQIKIRRH
jgi:hypothetical protein